MASQMKIKCAECGAEKGTTAVRYERLKDEGKLDAYLCRDCKKAVTPKSNKAPSQLKITCTKCGDKKGTTPQRYDRLKAEGKLVSYVCRSCKPKKIKAIHARKPDSDAFIDAASAAESTYELPEWMTNWKPAERRPAFTKDDYRELDTCFRPDIFFANKKVYKGDGCCNDCPMLSYCGCKTKVTVDK